METLKTVEKVSQVLVASVALTFSCSFAQTATTQYPPAYPNNANQPPAPQQGQSVMPGTVNYVEGQVSLDKRTLGPQGSEALQPGNTLSTGTNGFVEVLLTPGAFLRLGHNSEIRLDTAGLAATQIQLERGSANIEVDQFINGTHLAFTMNGATIQPEKKGLYDLNVDAQSVKVLDGKASVTVSAGTKSIGRGDQLLLSSEKPLKARDFDVKAEKTEPLYVWSEARSRDESQANVAVAQNVADYGGWYGPGWYWDPYWSLYAFLPGDGFLYSPFGWGFYSPGFVNYYGVPWGYGHYGHWGRYGNWHGHVGVAAIHSFGAGRFHGDGGFRGAGGFHAMGGGFHGGGGGRR